MSQMTDHELAQQLAQQFANNPELNINQELQSAKLAQQLALQTCIICQELFEGEILLTHTLNDGTMDCEKCRNLCSSCGLQILKTRQNKCSWSNIRVQFKDSTMELLEIMIENLNINDNLEEEQRQQEQEHQHQHQQERQWEQEHYEDEEEEEEEDEPRWVVDANNLEQVFEEEVEVENENWRRNQPCKYHFGLDGSILSGGGCHNRNCLFSHQQINCRFGHRCLRRMTCIFKHNH